MRSAALTGCLLVALTGCASDSGDNYDPGPAISPCAAKDLRISVTEDVEPVVEHPGVRLHFGRSSADQPVQPCWLTGYPAVSAGAGEPVVFAEQTPRGVVGGLPLGRNDPPTTVLYADTHAVALVEWFPLNDKGEPCPTSREMWVTAPGTDEPHRFQVRIGGCRLEVHPAIAVPGS